MMSTETTAPAKAPPLAPKRAAVTLLQNYLQRLAESGQYDFDLRWYEGWAVESWPVVPLGIVAADWNKLDPRLEPLLAANGWATQWCDGVRECCECNLAIETEPDSWGWRPQYWATEHGYVCQTCLTEKGGLESEYAESSMALAYLQELQETKGYDYLLGFELETLGQAQLDEDLTHYEADTARSLLDNAGIKAIVSNACGRRFSLWVGRSKLDHALIATQRFLDRYRT